MLWSFQVDSEGTQQYIYVYPFSPTGLPWGSVVKNLPGNAGNLGLIPVWGRSPRGRYGNPLQYSCMPVFLPGKPHGQRSLVGYSPWGHKESDTTEVTEHACMCSSPKLPSHPGCHTALSKFPVPYGRPLLVFHFIHSIVYMSIPNSLTIPSLHPSPLLTISSFFKFVSLFLFCK